jgi:steroid delta-isomerase-like uncharacterized protein
MDSPDVNQNIEIAQKSFDAFNRHEWEEQASFFSDTCQYLDPSYGKEYKTVSRKDKAQKYAGMEEKSPDIKDEITAIFGAEDKVVVQFISSGTAKTTEGSYSWSLPIITVFTFKDGLIVKDETYYDRSN